MNLVGDCKNNDMEARPVASNVRCFFFDGSFDAINSPQYLNFESSIPEPKDSFFDRKIEDDLPTVNPNAPKIHQLPMGDREDAMTYVDPEVKEEAADRCKRDQIPHIAITNDPDVEADVLKTPTIPCNNNMDMEMEVESVKAIGVYDAFARRETNSMATSTPFHVNGVVPMPWGNEPKSTERPHCTKTRPFSFEERNKQMQQRKARKLETVLQAEKEARKFRANPIPKFLKKKSTIDTNGSNENKHQSTEDQMSQSAPPRFRAKSPKVLRRSPFKPVLPKQHLVPQPFNLHSELRAKERAVFDGFIKEKEILDERIKELVKAAQKRREEEEIVKMRKAMVPKAQPIRKFKTPEVTVRKRPLTEPITPRVLKRQRR